MRKAIDIGEKEYLGALFSGQGYNKSARDIVSVFVHNAIICRVKLVLAGKINDYCHEKVTPKGG